MAAVAAWWSGLSTRLGTAMVSLSQLWSQHFVAHHPPPTSKLPCWSGWPGYALARLKHFPVDQVRVIELLAVVGLIYHDLSPI